MKITSVETHGCHARMRNRVFVEVVTDQPDLWGWGEATLEWHTRGIVGAIEDLTTLVVGEDPTRIEYLWQMMVRQHFWHGHGIERATAIAGIDIALWDILGKVAGMPCPKLWGGPVRDHVRTSCHLGGGSLKDFYETAADDAKRFADLARAAVADGFTAFESMAVPPAMPLEGLKPLRAVEQAVAAMREAVGESIDIMVDCHARPSPAMGIQFAKVLDPYGLFFLEEPCWPESIDGLRDIKTSCRTLIATRKRITDLAEFTRLFAAGACDVCQLDITHCGGLSSAWRIAALVEAHRLALAPHNPQGPVSTAASLEFGFFEPSYVICETVHADVPWREDVVKNGFTAEKQGRIVRSKSLPGPGSKINEAEVKKPPFQRELPQRVLQRRQRRRLVGDWLVSRGKKCLSPFSELAL
jgi:galactonate dehydratase